MRIAAAQPLTEILERDWDRQLFAAGKKPGLATQLGWESHWTFLSKGSRSGYPDRTACRDRIIFVELKRELTGKKSEDANRQPSDEQVAWLDRLAAAGGEVYLWRPSDLDEIAAVLSKRWRLEGDGSLRNARLAIEGRQEWQPRSLWIPGLGRADSHDNEQQTLLAKGAAA